MIRHPARISPLRRQQLQHRQQEIRDPLPLFGSEMVLLPQHVREGPVAQPVDIAQFAFAVEDLLGPFARQAEGFGEGAEELDDLRYVVVVFAVFGARLGVEEVVAGDEFEDLAKIKSLCSGSHCLGGGETHHTSHTPHIRASTPLRAQNHLRRPVLSCLDIVREMMSHPARIPQIGNLDGDPIDAVFALASLRLRRCAEIHIRHVVRENVSAPAISYEWTHIWERGYSELTPSSPAPFAGRCPSPDCLLTRS